MNFHMGDLTAISDMDGELMSDVNSVLFIFL